MSAPSPNAYPLNRVIGAAAGPVLAVIVYLVLPQVDPALPVAEQTGLTAGGRATAAVAMLMAVWWLSEALPLAVTSLLPLALFPLLGAGTFAEAATPYAKQYIFLFLGGFMLAIAMQRWKLHTRFALLVVRLFGTKPARLIAGFMLAAAVLSMWISNTATVVMMLPIALSVIDLVFRRMEAAVGGNSKLLEERGDSEGAELMVETRMLSDENREPGRHFAVALMLGVAYAASIGGVATIIGTPPNVIFAGFVRDTYGVEISFLEWMLIGVPVVVVFLPLCWLLLVRVLFPIRIQDIPGGNELIRNELERLGPMSRGERYVLIVFLCTAVAWLARGPVTDLVVGWQDQLIDQQLAEQAAASGVAVESLTRPGESGNGLLDTAASMLRGLGDAGIAIIAAIILFLLPSGDGLFGARLLDWEFAKHKVPWGVLLLFGGGLSLAAAMSRNGVASFIGQQFSGLPLSGVVLLLLVVTVVVFLTEMTSNTATTNILLPVLAGVATGLGVDPLPLLVATTIAASLAFMMPVATPPNAIIFGSGYVRISQMVKTGFWLNLIGIALVTALAYTVVGWVGIELLPATR